MKTATIAESTLYGVQTIRERVRASSVVGAGDTGFPAHVKLQVQVDTFLVNVAKHEPMLKVDQQLMVVQVERLIRDVQYVMTATGANAGTITLKEKYQKAINALTPFLPTRTRLHILPGVYPAGDGVLIIWMATGRRVPSVALPASVGMVVDNVQIVLNIARAIEQQHPITRHTPVVSSAVASPIAFTVPVGMSLRDVSALTGGATVDDLGFTSGGPMVGGLITSLGTPVGKTTRDLPVLPKSHTLIQWWMQDEHTVLSATKTVCEQCRLCTDLHPGHLIDYELSPHPLVRVVNYQQAATP